MLTAAQYEAIGRVALGLNDLEDVIGLGLSYILGMHEEIVSQKLVDRERFLARKIVLFREVLNALCTEYPNLEPEIKHMEQVLKEVDDVADRRNKIVHAKASRHPVQKGYGWMSRNQWISADAATIDSLAREVTGFENTFADAGTNLLSKLHDARAMRATSQR